jgi:hypothetical protein
MLSGTMPSGVFFAVYAQGNERGMSEQCQRNVPVPSLPSTHFILIQAALAFGCFKPDLDFPPSARDIGQRLPFGQTTRRIDHVVCMFTLFVETAPSQQVVSKAALAGRNLQAP